MSISGLPEPAQIRAEIERYQNNHEAVSEMQEYTDLTYAIPNKSKSRKYLKK